MGYFKILLLLTIIIFAGCKVDDNEKLKAKLSVVGDVSEIANLSIGSHIIPLIVRDNYGQITTESLELNISN